MYNSNPYGYGVSQQPWNRVPPPQMMEQLPRFEILRVNGQGGIDALRMAPNSEVLALDTSAPLIWLVQTDGAGYKTPTPYSIAPYQPQQAANPLEQRIAALEARMEAMMSEQSDPVPTKRRRPAAEPADE
ncbi:MAG: hypothetical protein IJ418_12130 [Clostridia bacterium]|nr:hypothetical protein [Clostridia bacterium]